MTWRVEQSCNFSNNVTRTTLVSTHSLKHIKTRKLNIPKSTSRTDCIAGSGDAGKREAVGKDDAF
jgi:hypothetical protein